jgi:hypothetical protein
MRVNAVNRAKNFFTFPAFDVSIEQCFATFLEEWIFLKELEALAVMFSKVQ